MKRYYFDYDGCYYNLLNLALILSKYGVTAKEFNAISELKIGDYFVIEKVGTVKRYK